MSRRISVGHPNQRVHSSSTPAAVQMVSVAVLPPVLPKGVAGRPTGVGMADAFNWDETLNWRKPDQPTQPTALKPDELPPRPRKSSFLKKSLPTTQRERRTKNPDIPPFVMRQIPFETWRKHYAKDAEGNYKGTHAPAEDCLLKPHDVEKWRLKEEGVSGSQWTRGTEALPVYHEAVEGQDGLGRVPGYEDDYEEGFGSVDTSRNGSRATDGSGEWREDYDRPPKEEPVMEQQGGGAEARARSTTLPKIDHNSGLSYDSQREQEELKRRNTGAEGWKNKMKRGLEMASMGGGGSG